MNSKRKGNLLEWAVMRAFHKAEYNHVQRGSASKGIDVIAARFEPEQRDFVSCKWNGYILPQEKQEFLKLAKFWNAEPSLTVPVYKNLRDGILEWSVNSLLTGNRILSIPMDEVMGRKKRFEEP